jgi:hypothetical protein
MVPDTNMTGQTSGIDTTTTGQTSGIGNIADGQTTTLFIPPVDETNINNDVVQPQTATDPFTDMKIIKLYKKINYQGDSKIMLPGMKQKLADQLGDKSWDFAWKSMRVTPNVKIQFIRDTGGGRTSRAFAYGIFDVSNIEEFMNSVPAIGSDYNIDTGMGMGRSYGAIGIPIYIHVSPTDDEWVKAQEKSYSGCISTINAWNNGSGRYTDDYCANTLPKALSTTGTIS